MQDDRTAFPPAPHRSLHGSRRTLLFGLAASAAVAVGAQLVGSPGAEVGPVTRSTDFPSLEQAAARWARLGGTLMINADYKVTAPITVYCIPGKAYRLTTDRPRTILYTGPHWHWFVCIHSEGRNLLEIAGELTIDGGNNCNIPFFARFETVSGNDRRNLMADGLTVANARMKNGISRLDGSPRNAYGASGALFMGGFDRLHLRNIKARNVTREAGAGRRGSQGCVGICVTPAGPGTVSAKHVTVEDFEIANVNSDDAAGSPARGDMDGLLVFQSAEPGGTPPIIQRGVVRESAGRAIKMFAPRGGGVTRDVLVERSVHGSTGGSNDIAHQHGDGLIENIVFRYSGNAHSQPSVPVGMSSGAKRDRGFPFGSGTVSNIKIYDTTNVPKNSLVSIYYNVDDPAPRHYILRDIDDTGQAQHLFTLGSLGLYANALVDLANVSTTLTQSLYPSEDDADKLSVVLQDVTNRGRPVPLQKFYDGRVAPRSFGAAVTKRGRVTGFEF